ncbi:class I SAM-dependent methyltransferase [Nocardia sp. alder85J]|uniref:class I SAM-dependent methyltransferase n=1 Tax=Nocardia sp. alder85J TaxID=2862949 RepID=UPI001CD7D29B|nr:class I SAM-dependent methyltransferase [Nocardia sp. alder85J]MCX4097587.1 class I SAM-dependent methyltransferase [Nocardia sp. alder85J]
MMATPSDPAGDRPATSHERRSGRPWDDSYRDGPAPWDIGGPQPAVARTAAAGGFTGSVLDVGCGTGENALHIAATGVPVLGVDVAETALALAREKAAARGLSAEFAVADALHLDRLRRGFDTALDSGLFHSFDAAERTAYLASLATVVVPGGTLHLLCLSDTGPDIGPHPVRLDELAAAFSPGTGWEIATVATDLILTNFLEHGASAWFATITRV